MSMQLSTDKLLQAVERLSLPELERFVSEVLKLRAKRVAPSISREEGELLTRINSGLPRETQARYRELIKKRREERLTEQEYQELLTLSDEAEQKQAERLEALVELAALRNMSLRELMDALGIKPAPIE